MSTSCNIAYNRDGNNAGRLFLIVIFFIVFVVVFFAVVVVVFLFGVTVAARAVAVGLIAVGTNVGEAIFEHFFGGLCQHLPFCSFLPLLVAVRLCVLFVNYYDCVQPRLCTLSAQEEKTALVKLDRSIRRRCGFQQFAGFVMCGSIKGKFWS